MQVPAGLPEGDVVDLGCGDGAAAASLRQRFPERRMVGVDASPAMIEEARGYHADHGSPTSPIGRPEDAAGADLLQRRAAVAAATTTRLLPRLAAALARRAGRSPCRCRASTRRPSHRLIREIAGGMFPDRFPQDDEGWIAPVAPPGSLPPPARAAWAPVGLWETEYLQPLAPVDEGHPVRAFTQSTALRPFAARMGAGELGEFLDAYDEALAIAYPAEADGTVLFPFRRLFLVLTAARRGGLSGWRASAITGATGVRHARPRPDRALRHHHLARPRRARRSGPDLVIHGEPLAEMPLTFAGFEGEVHAGLTRPSCSRVTMQHPQGARRSATSGRSASCGRRRSTRIAAELGLDALDPAWAGAGVVMSGIPDFTHVPPSSRLQGPRAAARWSWTWRTSPARSRPRPSRPARPGHGKALQARRHGAARRHRLGRARGDAAGRATAAPPCPGAEGLGALGTSFAPQTVAADAARVPIRNVFSRAPTIRARNPSQSPFRALAPLRYQRPPTAGGDTP